jgi:hypothetical protein
MKERIMNPLVPTALDGALMTVSLGALVLAFAAFVSLIWSSSRAGRRLLVWTLVVLFVPIVGPAMWFVTRHRQRTVQPRPGSSGS